MNTQPQSPQSSAHEPNTRTFGHDWQTDFSRRLVDYREFTLGNPRRDGIPPIDQPQFESIDQANAWLSPDDPVLVVSNQQHTTIYPLQILMWHEIVNDWLGELPIAVTFCPLCNIGVVFARQVANQPLTFGVSGLLRKSDLVMWDRQTESLWQQATGLGLVGHFAGTQLQMLPSLLVAWQIACEQAPTSRVLSRQTGFRRSYGQNPYIAYDQQTTPWLLQQRPNPQLPALERVVGLVLGNAALAYPFSILARQLVINDHYLDTSIAIFYQAGMASAVDAATIAQSHATGMGTAWLRQLDDLRLSFEWRDQAIYDRQTNSRWDISGRALTGPLQGRQLNPIIHGNHFWFAFAALIGEQTQTLRLYSDIDALDTV